jgi:cytochrome c553
MSSFRLLPALLALSCFAMPVAQAAGDPVRGKQLSTTCFACHGEDGNSPSPVNPRIGGQHESYILLAMQAYLDGTRKNSLMSGALLNKSPQELADIAAYFASQNAALNPAPAAPPGGAPGGPPGRGGPGGPGGPGGVVKFDHGARAAEFSALLARARSEAMLSQSVGEDACAGFGSGAGDSDGDGLANRFDAAPTDANEFATDTNGDGRFEICHAEQLQAMVTLNSDTLTEAMRKQRNYQLVRDIDAADIANFEPLGNCGPTGNCMRALGEFGFAGVFDGQGHSISGVRINYPERGGVGLFGVLAEGGVILNLRVEDIVVTGRAGTGAIVGSNFGVIYRSSARGRVDAAMAVGGLVGGSAGLVFASHFDGTVEGGQAMGGLVGDMTGAVYASHTSAAVKGERGIGGLVGLNTFGAIHDSHATGPVSGTNDIGGLVGVNTDARVRNSYATGTVTADGNNVGGLVGFNSLSTVRNAFAANAVIGTEGVGGLIGRNNGAVAHGFATGPVSAAGNQGAVVGIEVEGSTKATFPADDQATASLLKLTGESTGWAPANLPVKGLLDYFCDANGNGFIDPAERAAQNYIWSFVDGKMPSLRCETLIVGAP